MPNGEMKMLKEKLREIFGGVGSILYFLITILLCFVPLIMTDFHFLIDSLIIFAVIFIPIIGQIVYAATWAISLPIVISGKQDVFAIIYYVCFVIYLLVFFVPDVREVCFYFINKFRRER